MKRQWFKTSECLPEAGTTCDFLSDDVIVEDGDGTQMWGFYDILSKCWYRTDGNPIDKVKRWRYGRKFGQPFEGAGSDYD